MGNINTSRDFTYVTDVCDAYYEMLKIKNLFGEPVNVGSNKEYKIRDIAKKIIKKVNPKIKIKIEKKRIRPLQSEVDRLRCDNKLIIKKSKWRPKISFEEGLKKTIHWIKSKDFSEPSDIYRI